MKMAKPSERDIVAAGDLMTLLHQIDRGDYPCIEEGKEVPDWFDEDNFEHLRAFYDAVKATLDKGPGYPGRVIGGMCYVILYDKNKIIDPNSDVIDLHPELVKAQTNSERYEFLRSQMAFDKPAGQPVTMALRTPIYAPDHDVHKDWYSERFDASVDATVDRAMAAAPSTADSANTGALGEGAEA